MKMVHGKFFYKASEAAKLLQVTRQTLYSYIKTGKLKAVRFNRRYHIEKSNIDRMLGIEFEAADDLELDYSEIPQDIPIKDIPSCKY